MLSFTNTLPQTFLKQLTINCRINEPGDSYTVTVAYNQVTFSKQHTEQLHEFASSTQNKCENNRTFSSRLIRITAQKTLEEGDQHWNKASINCCFRPLSVIKSPTPFMSLPVIADWWRTPHCTFTASVLIQYLLQRCN